MPSLRRLTTDVALALALWALRPFVCHAEDPPSAPALVSDHEKAAAVERAKALDAQVGKHYGKGEYAQALPLARESLVTREKALGPDHSSTGTSLNNLAVLLQAMGDYAGAKPLLVRALAISEKAVGNDHPSTGTSLNNLAMLLQDMGDYAGAKPLFVRALAISEKAEGPDHPSTGTSLSNLAGLLLAMGDYAEAKPLFVRALALSEKAEGPDHQSTGTRLNNLAMLLEAMGDYAGAKPLFVRALAISESAEGPDHPSTGTSLNNLAALLQAMGDYAGAKPLFVRALAISEKAVGNDHPLTGRSLNNLASLLQDMGDYAGAKPLLVRALVISEKAEGPDHPSTGTSLNNLAVLLQAMGDYAGAKPLLVRALAISEKAVGNDHPSTGTRVSNLAMLLQQMGDYAGAKPLYERALAIFRGAAGPDHPSTGTSLSNLAVLLKDMGDYAGAKPLYEQVLALSERAVGPDHPSTATRLNNFAMLLQAMGDYAGAKPLFVRALAISEKAEGPDHPSTGTHLNNLALLLQAIGDYAGAKPLFVRALAISEKAEGPDHPSTGTHLNNLALLLQAIGDYAGAKPLFVRALAISERAEGPDHPSTGTGLNNLAMLLQDMGDYAGAKPLLVRALAISEKALGPDHPSTGARLTNLAALLQDMGDYVGAKAMFVRALQIAEAFVRRESLGAQSADRLALAKKFRWHLDSFLAGSEKLGLTGYQELLRFKGIIGRIDALDRSRTRQADPVLREQFESLAAVERGLSAMANAVPPSRDQTKTKAWQERYAALAAEREAKTRDLARDFAPFREMLEGKEVGLGAVQEELSSHEVLIDVVLSRGRYLAFVVGRTGEAVRLDLGEANKIEQAAADFVQASQRAGVGLPGSRRGMDGEAGVSDTASWEATGKALRELAFTPIETHLPSGTTTLYLVPDGSLAAVPFVALPGRESGRLLIDEYHVTYLSMAQELVPRKGPSGAGKGALLIGGVDYDKADAIESVRGPAGSPSTTAPVLAARDRAPRGGHFNALAATGPEVEGLAKQLGDGAAILLSSKATESRLRSLAVGKRMLHFATHGFVRTDLMIGLRPSAQEEQRWMRGGLERHLVGGHDPMLLAGLAMAGANPREGADGDDGILTAAEASYLDLSACDLVVLSACETARGTPESGEGVLGLVHGFKLAGAGSVVGSLWKVDDKATRRLMEGMYERMLRKESPLAPADALREAVLELRSWKDADGKARFAAPRYWAAFVAYGR